MNKPERRKDRGWEKNNWNTWEERI